MSHKICQSQIQLSEVYSLWLKSNRGNVDIACSLFLFFFHSLWINDDEESEFGESLRQSPPLNQTLWSPQVGGPGWRRFIFSWSCINSDLRDSPRASVHTRERWSCLGKKTCAQIRWLYLSDCETMWGNRPHAHGAGIPGGARDVTAQRWRSECFMF